jgi:hypothetical protein
MPVRTATATLTAGGCVVPHRLVENVGEVEVDLEAADAEGLLVEATTAFRELVDGAGGPIASHARVVLDV